MTMPANPYPPILTNADWRRLSGRTQKYAVASYELLDKAYTYLSDGDLRQASEKGWGSTAQIIKAVAEHWRASGITHRSHEELQALVELLAVPGPQSALMIGFNRVQSLHRNFYENDGAENFVALALLAVSHFVDDILPWLRRPRPPWSSATPHDAA